MPTSLASVGTTMASQGKAVGQGGTSPAAGTHQPSRVAGGVRGGCWAQLQAAGWRRLPTGLEDVSTYPALVAELLGRNWTQVEVEAALAKNLLRVFKKVEEVSGARGHAGHREVRHSGVYEDTGWHRDMQGRDEGGHGDMQGLRHHGDVQGAGGHVWHVACPSLWGSPCPHGR